MEKVQRTSLSTDLLEQSPGMQLPVPAQMLVDAFDLLPDASFVFDSNRKLVRANVAATQLETRELSNGRLCCDMFWHVEGADSCVVDRSVETGERVEVEILAGTDGCKSIAII